MISFLLYIKYYSFFTIIRVAGPNKLRTRVLFNFSMKKWLLFWYTDIANMPLDQYCPLSYDGGCFLKNYLSKFYTIKRNPTQNLKSLFIYGNSYSLNFSYAFYFFLNWVLEQIFLALKSEFSNEEWFCKSASCIFFRVALIFF